MSLEEEARGLFKTIWEESDSSGKMLTLVGDRRRVVVRPSFLWKRPVEAPEDGVDSETLGNKYEAEENW